MLPDFAILNDLSEILAFSKAFFSQNFQKPKLFSIDPVSQSLGLPHEYSGHFQKWGGRQKKSIRIFILQLKIAWPIATVAMEQKLSD